MPGRNLLMSRTFPCKPLAWGGPLPLSLESKILLTAKRVPFSEGSRPQCMLGSSGAGDREAVWEAWCPHSEPQFLPLWNGPSDSILMVVTCNDSVPVENSAAWLEAHGVSKHTIIVIYDGDNLC